MKKPNHLFTNIKLKYKNWSGTPPLLMLALTVTMGFVAIAILQGESPQSDFDTIKQATLSGNYGQYTWNPYPFYWFFYPFAILPHPIGFALWVSIGAIGLVVTIWKLGGVI